MDDYKLRLKPPPRHGCLGLVIEPYLGTITQIEDNFLQTFSDHLAESSMKSHTRPFPTPKNKQMIKHTSTLRAEKMFFFSPSPIFSPPKVGSLLFEDADAEKKTI